MQTGMPNLTASFIPRKHARGSTHMKVSVHLLQFNHRKSGNFHVKIIHVLNTHIDLFSWVYGTHENILT